MDISTSILSVILSLVSAFSLMVGGISSPSSTKTPSPFASSQIEETGEREYPAHTIWEIPYGMKQDEFVVLLEGQTGLTPEVEENMVTLDETDQLMILGHPASLFAYFTTMDYTSEEEELFSIDFELGLADDEGSLFYFYPTSEEQDRPEMVTEVAQIFTDLTAAAVEQFGGLTKTENVIRKDIDSEMEDAESPIGLDGSMDAELLEALLMENGMVMMYAHFDNVEMIFYATFDEYSAYASASVEYSFYYYSN